MTLFVGIDPSTKRIAIVVRSDEPRFDHAKAYTLLKASEKQDVASLGRALEVMRDFVQWVDQVAPDGERIACVESPLVGRGGVTTTMKQAFVGGIIRAVLHSAGFKVYDVNVSTWKSIVIGDGSAQKPKVARVLFERWPKLRVLVDDDGDLIDAGAICLYATGVQRPDEPVRGSAKPSRRGVQKPRARPKPVVRQARLR